jgi:hypothetical protein
VATQQQITIAPPNFQTAVFRIVGTAPYVQEKFSEKARRMMKEAQEAGSTAKKGKKREPKDFMADYQAAMHLTPAGWHGIPASGLRAAMISACRMAGFQMTRAKLSVFVEADGFDRDDGTPLVRITKGEPHYSENMVVNATGVADIRARPMWDAGWEALVRIRFDADQFTAIDVANLLLRVGLQVGIGAGRPDSSNSAGLGWGMFIIAEGEE